MYVGEHVFLIFKQYNLFLYYVGTRSALGVGMKQRCILRPLHKLALPQSPIQAAPLKLCTWTHFFTIYMNLIKVILIGCTVYMCIIFVTYSQWHKIHGQTTVTPNNHLQTLQWQQKEDTNKTFNLLFKDCSPYFSFVKIQLESMLLSCSHTTLKKIITRHVTMISPYSKDSDNITLHFTPHPFGSVGVLRSPVSACLFKHLVNALSHQCIGGEKWYVT